MPRSRRQWSTATGSGPASISTAVCAAAGSTIASPWPMSHATMTQPGGGQPEMMARTGIWISAATTAPTASSRQIPERQARKAIVAKTTSSASPPATPPGQPRLAPSRPPRRSATRTSQRHGHPASHASTRAPPSHTGAIAAATNPNTVAGATAGSASTFAGMATRLTRPEIAAMTGAVTACAAAATAIASATPIGTCQRRSWAAHPGAISNSAPVARADMAKPALVHSVGSQINNASTVADSAGTACLGRPAASEPRAIPAINAARSTLGEGRATTTKATSTSAPSAPHTHGRAPARRSASKTMPSTIEQFVPLTATRWVSPAIRNRSTSTGSSALVSPSTRPGSSPRSSIGSTVDAARRPDRTRPATRCHHGGWPMSSGGRCANSVAPVDPASSDGCNVPSTCTRWPGSTSAHP